MKKILIGLAVFIVLVVGALALVPVFYSIDQLRPQIQAAAEKSVRGKVELGKLSLSLLPAVRVNVDGVKLTAPAPYDKEPLAFIEAVRIEMPLLSLLGAPSATLKIEKPRFKMIQNGKDSNLASFLPAPPPAGTPAPVATTEKPVALGQTLDALPGWIGSRVKAARFSAEVSEGQVSLVDLKAAKGDHTEIKRLDVAVTNIGLATPVGLKALIDVDVASAGASVVGSLKTDGSITVTPQGAINVVTFDVSEDMSSLEIRKDPLFHKPSGSPLTASLKGKLEQGPTINVELAPAEFQFGAIKAAANVKIADATGDAAKAEVSLKVPDVDLAGFGTFISMVRDYKLGGKASVEVMAQGSLLDPTVNVVIGLTSVTGSTPQLGKPITNLNGKIRVSGTAKSPSVLIDPFGLKIGSGDISVKLETRGLEAPVVKLTVNSNRLDADELLGLKPVIVGEGPAAPKAPPSTLPLDDTLNQLAPTIEESLKNPMLDKVQAQIALSFKSIKALGAEYKDASFNMTYAKRDLRVSKTGIGAYGGRMNLDGFLQLDPKAMGFNFNAGLANVTVAEITKAHAPKWQNEVTGQLNGALTISGKGLRKEQVAQNLGGGLKGEFKDGRLSLPIVKVVTSVIGQLPSVGGKKVELPKSDKAFKGEFKTMKLASSIHGRMVKIDDLDVVYDTASLGIGDLGFKATGTVSFDRQVEITGTAIPSAVSGDALQYLKGPSGKVEIPLKVVGDMSDPKPDYGYSVGILGPRVAQNALKGTAGNAAKAAAGKALDKVKMPDPVKGKVNDLRKKFGF